MQNENAPPPQPVPAAAAPTVSAHATGRSTAAAAGAAAPVPLGHGTPGVARQLNVGGCVQASRPPVSVAGSSQQAGGVGQLHQPPLQRSTGAEPPAWQDAWAGVVPSSLPLAGAGEVSHETPGAAAAQLPGSQAAASGEEAALPRQQQQPQQVNWALFRRLQDQWQEYVPSSLPTASGAASGGAAAGSPPPPEQTPAAEGGGGAEGAATGAGCCQPQLGREAGRQLPGTGLTERQPLADLRLPAGTASEGGTTLPSSSLGCSQQLHRGDSTREATSPLMSAERAAHAAAAGAAGAARPAPSSLHIHGLQLQAPAPAPAAAPGGLQGSRRAAAAPHMEPPARQQKRPVPAFASPPALLPAGAVACPRQRQPPPSGGASGKRQRLIGDYLQAPAPQLGDASSRAS